MDKTQKIALEKEMKTLIYGFTHSESPETKLGFGKKILDNYAKQGQIKYLRDKARDRKEVPEIRDHAGSNYLSLLTQSTATEDNIVLNLLDVSKDTKFTDYTRTEAGKFAIDKISKDLAQANAPQRVQPLKEQMNNITHLEDIILMGEAYTTPVVDSAFNVYVDKMTKAGDYNSLIDLRERTYIGGTDKLSEPAAAKLKFSIDTTIDVAMTKAIQKKDPYELTNIATHNQIEFIDEILVKSAAKNAISFYKEQKKLSDLITLATGKLSDNKTLKENAGKALVELYIESNDFEALETLGKTKGVAETVMTNYIPQARKTIATNIAKQYLV